MQYIYGLRDPFNRKMRYIGKSVNPHTRYKRHLWESAVKRPTRKSNWIRNLTARGAKPELVILDEVEDGLINTAERAYIEFYHSRWLTNGTAGGDGGAITDPEARERIRQSHIGRAVSEETRAKMSAAHRKRYEDPEERLKQSIISKRLGSKPPTMCGSDNPIAKLTEPEVVKIRSLADNGLTARQIWEQEYQDKLTYQNIWMVVKRKTWLHV